MRKLVIDSFSIAIIILAVMTFMPDNSLANSAPEFDPIATQTVMEGESLNYTVSANDIDGDAIFIVAVSRPIGSTFIDNGDGTAEIQWQPDYTGPNSSNGSPFAISFMASDGMASSQIQFDVVVLNNNRRPSIDPVGVVEVEAGELISITLTGFDPDWKLFVTPPTPMSTLERA